MNCMCMDILAGCAGFINALDIAKLYIDMYRINTALVVGCRKIINTYRQEWYKYRNIACRWCRSNCYKKMWSIKLYDSYIESKGQKGEILTCVNNEKIYMDGKEVYKYCCSQIQ